MVDLQSFSGVIALWLASSFTLWWLNRRRKARGSRLSIELAHRGATTTAAAQEVFDAIRGGSICAGTGSGDPIARGTHALLKRIQIHGAYFDGVNALRAQIRRLQADADCPPLAEILHIRRDLWAAAEIVLMEDVRLLGEDFMKEGCYEALRAEAATLLFGTDEAREGDEDLICLRLALARGEAAKFVAQTEESARLVMEEERLPTIREIVAYPIATARAVPGQMRAARAHMARLWRHLLALAQTIRESRSLSRGAAGLRRARGELPERVAATLERTSAVTRWRAAGLRRHYEFLKDAHDLQARYEQLLAKRPELTERGRQFIARLELAARSERLRLTSANCVEWGRRHTVQSIAHVMAALPPIQARLDEAREDVARAAEEDPFKLPMSLPPLEEPRNRPEMRE